MKKRILDACCGGYIEVIERKKVPMNCSTCLYRGIDGLHCDNTNNGGKLMIQVNSARGCGWYWLDQNRFEKVW